MSEKRLPNTPFPTPISTLLPFDTMMRSWPPKIPSRLDSRQQKTELDGSPPACMSSLRRPACSEHESVKAPLHLWTGQKNPDQPATHGANGIESQQARKLQGRRRSYKKVERDETRRKYRLKMIRGLGTGRKAFQVLSAPSAAHARKGNFESAVYLDGMDSGACARFCLVLLSSTYSGSRVRGCGGNPCLQDKRFFSDSSPEVARASSRSLPRAYSLPK